MDNDCMELIWAPDTIELAKENWHEKVHEDTIDPKPRKSYTHEAPGNKDAIKFKAHEGEPAALVANKNFY